MLQISPTIIAKIMLIIEIFSVIKVAEKNCGNTLWIYCQFKENSKKIILKRYKYLAFISH